MWETLGNLSEILRTVFAYYFSGTISENEYHDRMIKYGMDKGQGNQAADDRKDIQEQQKALENELEAKYQAKLKAKAEAEKLKTETHS